MTPPPSAQELAGHYGALFQSSHGEWVLRDLNEAFVQRLNPALEEEMSQFPHPYRAYVEIGQRMVVQKLKAAIEASGFHILMEEAIDEYDVG
ncbi:MAG: hypothetical protein HQL51_13805 [Magnetococcales bacterium]|nr:hypothetical protein [Magnetococcales bacterium]